MDNRDIVISRYINLYPFISQIIRGEYTFSNLGAYEDSSEGYMKNLSFYDKIISGGKQKREFIKERDEFNRKHKEDIKNYFISCWTKKAEEDYALWKVFTNPNGGITIYTTVDKFIKSISIPLSIIQKDEVKYVPFSKKHFSHEINSIEECIFKKFDFYEYENEYRFAINSKTINSLIPKNPDYLNIPINFKNMIEKIVISPFMHPMSANYFIETLKKIDEKLTEIVSYSKISIK